MFELLYAHASFGWRSSNTKGHTMKKDKILKTAIIPAFIAVAALLLALAHVGADGLVGFGAVVMLMAIVAVEYRFDWKQLFGR